MSVSNQCSTLNSIQSRLVSILPATTIHSITIPDTLCNGGNKTLSVNAFTGAVNAGRLDASPSFAANTNIKTAFAYGSNFRAVTSSGATPTVSNTVFTIPTCTNAGIGNASSINQINGYIRKINYYPMALTNAELQAVSK